MDNNDSDVVGININTICCNKAVVVAISMHMELPALFYNVNAIF